MLKNKVSNRLLGTIISASILFNTLLVSLPLNSQPLPGETTQQTTQRERLKIGVEQKIKQIKSVSDRIKRAKIAAPALLIAGGVTILAALAAAAITVVALYFFIPKIKLKEALSKHTFKKIDEWTTKLKESKYITKHYPRMIRKDAIGGGGEWYYYNNDGDKFLGEMEIIYSKLLKPIKNKKIKRAYDKATSNLEETFRSLIKKIYSIGTEIKKKENYEKFLLEIYKEKKLPLKKLNQFIPKPETKKGSRLIVKKLIFIRNAIAEKGVNVEKIIEKKARDLIIDEINKLPAKSIEENIKKTLQVSFKKLGILLGISGIGAILLGFAGTGMATVGANFGLSPLLVKTALDNAKELEQIGTLTPQQKQILAKFQKQLKSPIINGMIKNIRLKGKLTNLVNSAMATHTALIKPLENETLEKREKRTRKIFSDYIKAKKQEKLLQKVADEYANLNISGFKVFNNKRKLNKQKKKVAKLQASYPGIKAALEKAAQKYSQAEDKMQEEIKENLMESVDTKEFQWEMREFQQRSIVPL